MGFVLDRVSGSHHILMNVSSGRRAVVPKHNGDLPKGTVKSVLRESGISLEEFLNA
jgi:predicted RNA binding protein YcfA (HicA-like mRNA interferase family)